MILVVSGPSGVGKSKLIDSAVSGFGFERVVPYTTRGQRPQEVEGVDYRFVSREEFQGRIRSGQFFDWDYTVGNYYGYSHEIGGVHGSRNVVVPVVSRMAPRLSQRLENVFLLFLDGSDTTLDHRMAEREHPPEELLLRRLHRDEERVHAPLFDEVIRQADQISDPEIPEIIEMAVQRAGEGPS